MESKESSFIFSRLPRKPMDEMDDLSDSIRRDTRLVFTLSNLVGTFPYSLHSLKRSKVYYVWSIIVFGTVLRLLSIAYTSFNVKTNKKLEFYNNMMLRFLLCVFVTVCLLLFYSLMTMRKNLRSIFLELNRVQSYFTQLSCQDATPDKIAKKQRLTVSLFLLGNLIFLVFRFILLWRLGIPMTCAMYIINLISFSSILQCTNLLDIVKHYLNIINVELINISENQDKQHFIHLYKSRICVLNNMLPDNYLCRRKLKVLVQLHFSLCKLCHDIVNRTYSPALFLLMFLQSCHLCSTLYLILVIILQSKQWYDEVHHIFYFHVWAIYNMFILFWIIRHCETTKHSGLSLLELVYHKIIYNEVPILNSELTHFLNCIYSHKIRFRALDMFEIDYSALSNSMAAVFTYLVIMVQLGFAGDL